MKKLTIKAPGRINVIGEHTDYNLGYVLPTAIDKYLNFTFEKNGTPSTCKVKSKGYGEPHIFDFSTMERSSNEWHNYIQGVVSEILKVLDQRINESTHRRQGLGGQANKLRGFNCSIESNLPVGSGVSSSAALESGLSYGLNELFDLGLSKIEMVKLSQQADHNYVGVQSGIMDQFASMMSKEGHVILLDCRSLDYEYIPLDLNDYTFLLLNSGVSHSHVSSEYNTRQQECQEGVRVLQQNYPEVESLRDVTSGMMALYRDRLSSTVYRRCSFVIEENKRVLAAVEALKKGDLSSLGTLMYASHEGLRHDYEVSCKELDFLVDFSRDYEQVLGARIMGGGFGGCSINLIKRGFVDLFIRNAAEAYRNEYGIELEAFEALPSRGVSIVKSES